MKKKATSVIFASILLSVLMPGVSASAMWRAPIMCPLNLGFCGPIIVCPLVIHGCEPIGPFEPVENLKDNDH